MRFLRAAPADFRASPSSPPYAYFSTKADGSDTTDQFLGTATTAYFIVRGQGPVSGASKVTLETTPKLGPGRVKDSETFRLESIAFERFRATIPLANRATSIPGDGKLQLILEDLITGKYKILQERSHRPRPMPDSASPRKSTRTCNSRICFF